MIPLSHSLLIQIVTHDPSIDDPFVTFPVDPNSDIMPVQVARLPLYSSIYMYFSTSVARIEHLSPIPSDNMPVPR